MLPLEGVKVIEFSGEIAGPYCTMQLGDAGAEVIKVEPLAGDPARHLGPHIGDESALFLSLNRNKKSIAVDARQALGQQIVHRLVADGDIFVESFGADEMHRLRLGYEDLAEINRRLVYCSITPFGDIGPYRNRPASELEIQAMSGYIQFLGELGKPPVRLGADVAAVGAGIHGAVATLAALLHRNCTGFGQKVEASMLATLLWYGGPWIGANSNPDFWGGYFVTGPFDKAETGYKTKDLPIAFGLFTRDLEQGRETWRQFAKAIGLENLLEDPYWLEHGARLVGIGQDAQAMKPVFESAMATKSAEELMSLLNSIRGMGGVIYDYKTVFGVPHPQVTATGMVQEMDVPSAGKVKVAGLPCEFSETPLHIGGPPPKLGEHTNEILARLGYGVEQVADLREAKVVA